MEDVFDQIQVFREAVSACQKKGLVTWVFSGLPLTLRLSKTRQLTLWFCSERQQISLLCVFDNKLKAKKQFTLVV